MEKVQTYECENSFPLNVGKIGLQTKSEVNMIFYVECKIIVKGSHIIFINDISVTFTIFF